jgi:hypothetical protein
MDNTNGVRRASEKFTRLSTATYDGLARDGELVIDLDTHDLYIGNAQGNLNLVGGFSGTIGAPVGSFQFNNGQGTLGGSDVLVRDPVTGKVIITNLAKFSLPGGNPGDVLSTDGAGNLVWINSCCNDCYDAVLTVDSATWSSDDPATTNKTIAVVTTLNNDSTVASIVRLVIAGFVIDTTGIAIVDGEFTIPAAKLPVDLQSDTNKLTLVLTVLDSDDVSHGPASVTVIPRLGGGGVTENTPFSVYGTLELTVADGVDRPFWDADATTSRLTVGGLVLDGGIIESVTYTLRNEDGIAIGTPRVVNNFRPVQWTGIAPGRYYVEALVFGRASGGPAISVSRTYRTDITDNPGVITKLGETYEPLLFTIDPTEDPQFTTGNNYVPKQFTDGDEIDFPDTTGGDYFIVAVPGNFNNDFEFTVAPLPPAELFPDSDYEQAIDGVTYKMYAFTGGTEVTVKIRRSQP